MSAERLAASACPLFGLAPTQRVHAGQERVEGGNTLGARGLGSGGSGIFLSPILVLFPHSCPGVLAAVSPRLRHGLLTLSPAGPRTRHLVRKLAPPDGPKAQGTHTPIPSPTSACSLLFAVGSPRAHASTRKILHTASSCTRLSHRLRCSGSRARAHRERQSHTDTDTPHLGKEAVGRGRVQKWRALHHPGDTKAPTGPQDLRSCARACA